VFLTSGTRRVKNREEEEGKRKEGEPGYRLWTDQRPKNGRRLILTGMKGVEGIRVGVGLGFI